MQKWILSLVLFGSLGVAHAQPVELVEAIRAARVLGETAQSMPPLYQAAEHLASLTNYEGYYADFNWLGPYWAAQIIAAPPYQVPLDTLVLNGERTLAYLEQALTLHPQPTPWDLASVYMVQKVAYNRIGFAKGRRGDTAARDENYARQADAVARAIAADSKHPAVLAEVAYTLLSKAGRDDERYPLQLALAAKQMFTEAVAESRRRYQENDIFPNLDYMLGGGVAEANRLIARLLEVEN